MHALSTYDGPRRAPKGAARVLHQLRRSEALLRVGAEERGDEGLCVRRDARPLLVVEGDGAWEIHGRYIGSQMHALSRSISTSSWFTTESLVAEIHGRYIGSQMHALSRSISTRSWFTTESLVAEIHGRYMGDT